VTGTEREESYARWLVNQAEQGAGRTIAGTVGSLPQYWQQARKASRLFEIAGRKAEQEYAERLADGLADLIEQAG